MKPKDHIKKLKREALDEGTCDMCINCKNSYFPKGEYMGICKYTEAHRDIMYPKPIFVYDTCDHWEKKEEK